MNRAARLLSIVFILWWGDLAGGQSDWADLLEQIREQRTANPASALQTLDRLLDKDPGDWVGEQLEQRATLYRLRVEILRDQGDYARANIEAERFFALASLSRNAKLTARAFFLLGSIQAEQGFFGEALEHFHQARQVLESSSDAGENALILNAIGMTHNFAGDYGRARHYFERALAEARQAGNDSQIAGYLSNLATVVAELYGPNAAIDMQREVLAIGEAIGEPTLIAQAKINLCNFMVSAEHLDEAASMCLEALEAADATGVARWRAGVHLTMGKLAMSQGHLDDALRWYEEALGLALDVVPVLQEELLERLAEVHLQLGAPEAAIARYQEMMAFRDAARERERKGLVEELEIRYQLERTRTELDLLRLGQQLQSAQIRMRNGLLIALVVVLAISLLAVTGALRSNRIKAGLQQDLSRRNQELQKALATISSLARTEPLTGLLNRRALEEMAVQAIARCRRESQPICVLMCDIDHFKPLNDEHGHGVGDELLIGLAQRLRQTFRECDLVSRWGGEEFVCLLPGTCAKAAEAAIQRLREELVAHPIETSIGPIGVTLTWGVAEIEEDLCQAVNRADQALYAGKRAGRNRTTVHPVIQDREE